MQDELLNLLKETGLTISQDSNSCNFYNDTHTQKKKLFWVRLKEQLCQYPVSGNGHSVAVRQRIYKKKKWGGREGKGYKLVMPTGSSTQ